LESVWEIEAMSIIEDLKEIADLARKYNDDELNQKIVKLEEEIVEFTLQIGSLEEETQELKRTFSVSKKMKFKKPLYYQEDDPIPFCPRCWEKDRKPVHLLGPVKVGAGLRYGCPNCKGFFVQEGKGPSPNI
jgi:hypothetical protein